MTMAAARLVMQSWGEDYLKILLEAGLDVDFLAFQERNEVCKRKDEI